MSDDRLTDVLEGIGGKGSGTKIEETLKELYPRLKTDQNIRDEFASCLEGKYLTEAINTIVPSILENPGNMTFDDGFNNLVTMIKLGIIMNAVEKNASNSDFLDRYEAVKRFTPYIAVQTAVTMETVDNDTPLSHSVANSEYLFSLCQASAMLHYNEYKPTDPNEMGAQIEKICRCHSNSEEIKRSEKFLRDIRQEAVISSEAMGLIGIIHPNFKEKSNNNHPDIQNFHYWAMSHPRHVFAACIDMIAKREKLIDPQMLVARMNKPEVISAAMELTKEKCIEIVKDLHPSAASTKERAKVFLKDLIGKTKENNHA